MEKNGLRIIHMEKNGLRITDHNHQFKPLKALNQKTPL